MYQFVLIDRSLIGFAIFWTIPPVLVVLLDLFVPMRKFAKTVVLIYLLLAACGTWLSVHPQCLPGMGGLSSDRTSFAMQWNRLPLPSRRLIAWNMALASSLLFWWMGYGIGWVPLTRPDRRMRQLSWPVAVLVIAVAWGLPLLAAPALIAKALGKI